MLTGISGMTGLSGLMGGSSYTTPLDSVSDLYFAVSVRRISSLYSGPCMRVVRQSDSAIMDFGFTEFGIVDSSAILSWLAGSSGRVSIWYDQSGVGNDMVQATNASRPFISNAGTLYTQDGFPTLYFQSAVFCNLECLSSTGWSVDDTHMFYTMAQAEGAHIGVGVSTVPQNSCLGGSVRPGTTYGLWCGGWGQTGSPAWEGGTFNNTTLKDRSKAYNGSFVRGHLDNAQVIFTAFGSYSIAATPNVGIGIQVPLSGAGQFAEGKICEAIGFAKYDLAELAIIRDDSRIYYGLA